MANKKISQLNDGTSFQAGDEAVVNRSGVNYKVDPTQFGSSIDVTGSVTADGADLDGAVVINESGADVDFRVESDTVTNALFVRGSDGFIGIGTSSPHNLLTLDSNVANTAMTIRSSDSGVAAVVFGDQSDASSGRIIYDNSDDSMAFETNNLSEAMRIDSSGRVLVGTSTARTNFFNSTIDAALQLEGTGGQARMSLVSCFNSAAAAAEVVLAKQKSGSAGGNTIVASGDIIGNISYQGNDGTEFVEAASIEAQVDGTPGANDMPGRLVFSTTADGGSTPTERMRIDSGGRLLIGTTDSFPGNNDTNVGISLSNTGNAAFSCDSNRSIFNRNLTDGSIVEFRGDGSLVGSIGSNGGYLYIGSPVSTDAYISFGASTVSPSNSTGSGRDAGISLGSSSYRFKDLYLSGGVYLGGTGAANLLDDYEEGTFTPTFVSTGGGTAAGYGTQAGRYTKIGRLVYASMRVTLSDKTGLNAGNVAVDGLPFTANSTNVGRLGVTLANLSNISSYTVGDTGGTFLSPNSAKINLLDNALNAVTVADLANNSQIDIQVTYET